MTWLILLVACEAIPVDSGVYFAGNSAVDTSAPDGSPPDDDPPDTKPPDTKDFCVDTLPKTGERYTGTVSKQLNDADYCEGSATLVLLSDKTVTLYAYCTGSDEVCLEATGTLDSGTITASMTVETLNGPSIGPHDVTGTIDDKSATLSWSYTEKDPTDRPLNFVGEATVSR